MYFFFSSRRRHTISDRDWSSDVCSSDLYAVTSNVEAAKQFGASEILPVPDWVGGRLSVCSAVGFASAGAMGFDAFQEFLSGAHEIARHFAQAPLEAYVPVLMGPVAVLNGNFLGA